MPLFGVINVKKVQNVDHLMRAIAIFSVLEYIKLLLRKQKIYI